MQVNADCGMNQIAKSFTYSPMAARSRALRLGQCEIRCESSCREWAIFDL
jgi:hypothetical protein